MEQFKDLAVEGQAIAEKPEHERWAEIIEPKPHYQVVPSLDDPSKSKEKLIVSVKITGKDQAEYYPNKTSGRFIANRCGTNFNDWIGKKISWKILDQKVAGQDKKVLYVEKVEDMPKKPKVIETKQM